MPGSAVHSAPPCLSFPSSKEGAYFLPASPTWVLAHSGLTGPYWEGRGGGADLSVGHVCPWGQSLSSPPGVIAWWQLLDTWVHSMEDGEGGDNNMVPGHLRPWLGWGGG